MIIIKNISTLTYTLWHVDKYEITFTLVSLGLSRPSIIDAMARGLRKTVLDH